MLASLPVNWASVVLIPRGITNDIEKIMRNFLWNSGENRKGVAKVAWNEICKPKIYGGLGLKNLKDWNIALLSDRIWKILSGHNSLWVRWVNSYLLEDRSFWDVGYKDKMSWSWRNLLKIRPHLRDSFYVQIGSGEGTFMWFDNWHQLGPLSYVLSPREIANAGYNIRDRVSDVIVNEEWSWPDEWLRLIPQLGEHPVPSLIRGKKDVVFWLNWKGDIVPFAVNQVSSSLICHESKVGWHELVWFQNRISSHCFILWLAILGRLRTQDRMKNWKDSNEFCCAFCYNQMDSHSHLFFDCNFPKEVWDLMKDKVNLKHKPGMFIQGIDGFGIFITFSLKSELPPWKQGVYIHGIDGFVIFITFSFKSELPPWKQGVYIHGIDGFGIFIIFSLKSESPPWKQGVYIQGIDGFGIFITFSLKSESPPWKQGVYIQGIDGFGIFITFSLKSESPPWKQGVYIQRIDGYFFCKTSSFELIMEFFWMLDEDAEFGITKLKSKGIQIGVIEDWFHLKILKNNNFFGKRIDYRDEFFINDFWRDGFFIWVAKVERLLVQSWLLEVWIGSKFLKDNGFFGKKIGYFEDFFDIEIWFDFFNGWGFVILGMWNYVFIGIHKTFLFLGYMMYKSLRCTKLDANLDTNLGLKLRQECLKKLRGFGTYRHFLIDWVEEGEYHFWKMHED
ncbi:unnamed protein product [Lactuca virosa]|uniref:Reverse transcriptase zinc-binding domain-containing protein n=1 Tax=Lactuca virosa TaxID=75947 RepID=A0AAU9PBW7_9ASTR|nr:unnamed protein product [Lactuca virosa]